MFVIFIIIIVLGITFFLTNYGSCKLDTSSRSVYKHNKLGKKLCYTCENPIVNKSECLLDTDGKYYITTTYKYPKNREECNGVYSPVKKECLSTQPLITGIKEQYSSVGEKTEDIPILFFQSMGSTDAQYRFVAKKNGVYYSPSELVINAQSCCMGHPEIGVIFSIPLYLPEGHELILQMKGTTGGDNSPLIANQDFTDIGKPLKNVTGVQWAVFNTLSGDVRYELKSN